MAPWGDLASDRCLARCRATAQHLRRRRRGALVNVVCLPLGHPQRSGGLRVRPRAHLRVFPADERDLARPVAAALLDGRRLLCGALAAARACAAGALCGGRGVCRAGPVVQTAHRSGRLRGVPDLAVDRRAARPDPAHAGDRDPGGAGGCIAMAPRDVGAIRPGIHRSVFRQPDRRSRARRTRQRGGIVLPHDERVEQLPMGGRRTRGMDLLAELLAPWRRPGPGALRANMGPAVRDRAQHLCRQEAELRPAGLADALLGGGLRAVSSPHPAVLALAPDRLPLAGAHCGRRRIDRRHVAGEDPGRKADRAGAGVRLPRPEWG